MSGEIKTFDTMGYEFLDQYPDTSIYPASMLDHFSVLGGFISFSPLNLKGEALQPSQTPVEKSLGWNSSRSRLSVRLTQLGQEDEEWPSGIRIGANEYSPEDGSPVNAIEVSWLNVHVNRVSVFAGFDETAKKRLYGGRVPKLSPVDLGVRFNGKLLLDDHLDFWAAKTASVLLAELNHFPNNR